MEIALAGCGYWGQKLIRSLRSIPGVGTIYCFDIHPESIPVVPTIRTVRSFDDILANPDIGAIFFATPASTHYRLAESALKKGKHIFMEKPMTLSSGEADSLIALSEHTGKIIHVDHTYLYSREAGTIKEMLDGNRLGTIFSCTSVRTGPGRYQPDCDVIWDLAPHDFSLLLDFFGQPKSVSCLGERILGGSQCDAASLTVGYPGFRANIRLSWLAPVKTREFTIVGSRAILRYDDLAEEDKIGLYEYRQHLSPHTVRFALEGLTFRHVPVSGTGSPLERSCLAFIQSITDKRSPISDAVMGRDVVRMIEKAHQSMELNGRTVQL